MYGDVGTAPARSWNDLLATTGGARGAGSRIAVRRATPRSGAAGPTAGAAAKVRRRIATLAASAAAVTVLAGVAPSAHLAYRSPATHVFIDTAATVIALLVAILLAGRYRRSGLLRDLLLLAAMGVLSVANLLLSVLPALVDSGPAALSTWALLGSRLLGAALLAGAYAAPLVRLRAPGRAAAAVLAACAACVALFAAGAVVLADQLPPAVEAGGTAAHPRLVGHPLVLAAQLVGMALLAGAAAGFTRLARAQDDEFLGWLAAGAILGAFARLNHFLFPSLFTDVVSTGDLFYLAGYALLLTGALREIGAHHRGLADAAVLQERRRIARDLHDGLAQDLAFIAARVRVLERDPRAPVRLDHLTSAANRALDDSRTAISGLTRPLDEPLEEALARNATETAERLGGCAVLHLETGIDVPVETRESLVRIVRESVSNALRHGRAGRVAVSLSRDRELRLSIADDGSGFDASPRAAPPEAGFGLVSMRERAEALGGAFAVRSTPGSGTTIEVVLPCLTR